MLDMRRLKMLVQLRQRGTIAAVGEAMHYSPSGVSQQLAILESEVGAKLLERVGRGVKLTIAGDLLCQYAVEILDTAEAAEASIAELEASAVGSVRIAAFQSFNLAILPELVGELERAGISVHAHQLEPELSIPALLESDFDVVIAEGYGDRKLDLAPPLRSLVLLREQLFFAHAQDHSPALEDVAAAQGEKWVMEPTGTVPREWAMQFCRAQGFEPTVRYEAADMLTHVGLIRAGLAVGFLPALIARSTNLEGVEMVPLEGQVRKIKAITRSQSWRYPVIGAAVEVMRTLLQPHRSPE